MFIYLFFYEGTFMVKRFIVVWFWASAASAVLFLPNLGLSEWSGPGANWPLCGRLTL